MWALRKIIPAALVLLLVLVPAFAIDEIPVGETQPETSSVVDVLDGDVSDDTTEQPSEPDPEGPTELDYLVSINTYLTYLFGFAVVVFAWWSCSLMYKFLNMFF